MADYTINAKHKRLGRLASDIAVILMGKKTPSYDPSKVSADRVLVENYKDITVSGNKEEDKIYYRHTGYVGHLKETRFKDAFSKDPKKVLRDAVRHMLPKNFLNQKRIKNLVFIDHD